MYKFLRDIYKRREGKKSAYQKRVYLHKLLVFSTSTCELPLPSYFIACNVHKKGSLGILFTKYTVMGWWIYNNIGYIVMSCFGIHSHGHCKLPPTTTTLAGQRITISWHYLTTLWSWFAVTSSTLVLCSAVSMLPLCGRALLWRHTCYMWSTWLMYSQSHCRGTERYKCLRSKREIKPECGAIR